MYRSCDEVGYQMLLAGGHTVSAAGVWLLHAAGFDRPRAASGHPLRHATSLAGPHHLSWAHVSSERVRSPITAAGFEALGLQPVGVATSQRAARVAAPGQASASPS